MLRLPTKQHPMKHLAGEMGNRNHVSDSEKGELIASNGGKVSQTPADPLYGTAGDQFATDTSFRCPAMVVADWNSKAGIPTYQYQFSRGIPGHPEIGAVHATSLVYVFGSLEEGGPSRPNYQPEDYAISKAMQKYWTNFAKTGSPDGIGLPHWPRYQPDSRKFMEFTDSSPVAGAQLRQKQREVFAAAVERNVN